jgi:predicted O-linked N-acetylglucosamine transferase (SPINDLY family)
MGVPVITLSQKQMAGRQTEAFLRCIGAGELTAANADDYVRMAVELVGNTQRLAGYRTRLRQSMRDSALFDHASFTRALEEAYQGMWQQWCESGRPADLPKTS